jgi:hypothetical protein
MSLVEATLRTAMEPATVTQPTTEARTMMSLSQLPTTSQNTRLI